MTALSNPAARTAPTVTIVLLPIMAIVFFAFLVAGVALPVLPLHVHEDLGRSTFIVGLVSGSQFAAALLTRMWAGRYADSRGAKRAVTIGLFAAGAGGVLYLVSLLFVNTPNLSVSILLVGRAVLGGGESFIITGALGWGLALVGMAKTGRVMAWMGTAMYAAFALGAPLGTLLNSLLGFQSIAWVTALVPLAILVLIRPMRAVTPTAEGRPSFLKVLGSVWIPGVGLALSSFGFGAITAFSALLFAQHGWSTGWVAFSAFAACFMLARVACGDLVDRLGGARVALFSIGIEVAGQLMMWAAPWPSLAIVGAGLTGLGYSLIFPGLGVEAVRRAPSEARALAMGAYTSCLDLALGLGAPLLGLIAGRRGMNAVFLSSAVVIACASVAVSYLLRNNIAKP